VLRFTRPSCLCSHLHPRARAPAAAPALDKEFRLTFGLTYHTLGPESEDVNTEPFRTAVWYYIQRLYGVRNDHYDYREVSARGGGGGCDNWCVAWCAARSTDN
jgi:hypothetical protein